MDIPGQWWTLFQSPKLDHVVEQALKGNPDVGAAQAALRQAKSCIDQGVELDSRGALALELQAMEENIARDTWRAGMSRFGGDKR